MGEDFAEAVRVAGDAKFARRCDDATIGFYIAYISAFLPATVLCWPAVVAALVIGILIAIHNANALHNWIAGCYFGTDQKYSDLHAEVYAYDKAVGA